MAIALPVQSGARIPIRPHGHKPFAPRLGDWEGVANGFPASFELRYNPRFAGFGLAPYEFGNLVTFGPSSCPASPTRYSEGIIGSNSLTPLKASGAFPLQSFGLRGKLRGKRRARLATKFSLPAVAGGGCQGTLDWAMRPAKRKPVDDGTWTLKFSDSETETFDVSGGGRLVTGIGFPQGSGGSDCGGFGAVDLFIEPAGTASFVDATAGLDVSLGFASAKSASGQWVAGACQLGMTASLTKPAP